MNSFKVSISYYNGKEEQFNKSTKWHSPHRLAQHVMSKLDKQGIAWKTVTVEWEGK